MHMKKLLVVLSLLLAASMTAVACNQAGDHDDPEASGLPETNVSETPSAEATEEPTEAPTVPPEWLTNLETEKVIEIPTEAPTEPVTEAVGDPAVPATVLGIDKLTSIQGRYNLEKGIADNGDYVTIVPTGEDPYYYPAYNFSGGRYIIIKYRTSTCDGVNMQVYLASNGTGPSDDSTMLEAPLVGDGNWNYLVIDTQPLIDAGKYDGKTVAYLRFDPLDPGYKRDENGEIMMEGSTKLRETMPENATVDVAYIAFCHAPDTMQNLESGS